LVHRHEIGWVTDTLFLVPDRPDFPQEEVKVLNFWKEIDAFKQQNERTKGRKPYTFYDGPPFATGLPHYGHIAAGTIKVSRNPPFLIRVCRT
jgi:isoleucyl-tRNA synthetase